MLHIHNGDSACHTLKESGLAGEHLVWREALVEGATPQSLSNEEWIEVRARHLSETYGQDFTKVADELRRQEETLDDFARHDEVVLWFEHDLFCQTILVYLLERFARAPRAQTRISLVCIGSFPGVEDFRGLGQLAPAQMASLFDARSQVTEEQFALARDAWAAYSAPDTQALRDLLSRDTSALPHLAHAFAKHLARFPSARNGLGLVEQTALELIDAGHTNFLSLFPAFSRREPVYGFGDAQFWLALRRLARAPHPLLAVGGDVSLDGNLTPDQVSRATFALTDDGRAVLACASHFVALNGIDLWLGGVHLRDDAGTVFRAN
jgi:hypothetical protein